MGGAHRSAAALILQHKQSYMQVADEFIDTGGIDIVICGPLSLIRRVIQTECADLPNACGPKIRSADLSRRIKHLERWPLTC
jgi:hypothetical protein